MCSILCSCNAFIKHYMLHHQHFSNTVRWNANVYYSRTAGQRHWIEYQSTAQKSVHSHSSFFSSFHHHRCFLLSQVPTTVPAAWTCVSRPIPSRRHPQDRPRLCALPCPRPRGRGQYPPIHLSQIHRQSKPPCFANPVA